MRKRLRTGITSKIYYLIGYGRIKLYETCNKHKKEWPEGDDFERNGGRACEECVNKARPTKYRRGKREKAVKSHSPDAK